MLALYVPYNMIRFPLCVITCLASFVLAMLTLRHLAWVSLLLLAFLHLFLCVHDCIFVYLFMSSSLVPTYDFMQVHARLCTRNPESLLGAWWHKCRTYSNIMELLTSNPTHIIPSRTPFLVCLLACLFPLLLACLVCWLSASLLLCYLFCLSAGFMFSLFVCHTCMECGHGF